MKGFPKHLNSKFDYYYIIENFPEKLWRPKWQNLWDGRKRWLQTGKLAKPEDGIEDETHRIEERVEKDQETEGVVTTWWQFEYKDYPASPFWQLDFTEAEVKKVLGIDTDTTDSSKD